MHHLYYNGYFIRAVTQQTTKGWTAQGRIRPKQGGSTQSLYPPETVFLTEGEACAYALAFGKQWVDDQG